MSTYEIAEKEKQLKHIKDVVKIFEIEKTKADEMVVFYGNLAKKVEGELEEMKKL